MPIKFRWPQDINAIKFGSVLVWSVLGVVTTISGTSPLSLANALTHNIKSLIQYGKCTQASTPTPSSPVDIKCNNGALKWDSVNQRICADGTPEVLSVTAIGKTPQTVSVANLLAVGDYKDQQDVIRGLLTHKVGIKMFDGTERWREATHKGVFFTSANIGTIETTRPILCNAFSYSGAANANMPNYTGKLANTSAFGGAFHFVYDEYTSDVDGFTAWLAAQYTAGTPVIVVYPLIQEITESVMPQPLSTAEGDNTITVDAEADGINLEVTYYTTE